VVSVLTRREQVAYARARGVSCRRACALLSVARSSFHCESKLAAKDAPVVARMHVYSARYPRWGYRRVRILLGRDGMAMSRGRAHRLWKKAGPQVPKKRRRRRLAASRPRPHPPTGPNQVWAYVLGWLSRSGVKSAFIAPGKPWQNATNESFNGKFRDECLNMHWFSSSLSPWGAL
jgi:transposase InsO family protein